jgi:hypothetical protein
MGCGGVTMAEICSDNRYGEQYQLMARAQDAIGWWRFMEGMVCKEIQVIQKPTLLLADRGPAQRSGGCSSSQNSWR